MKSVYIILVLVLVLLLTSAYSFWKGDVRGNCQYQTNASTVDCDEYEGAWRDL